MTKPNKKFPRRTERDRQDLGDEGLSFVGERLLSVGDDEILQRDGCQRVDAGAHRAAKEREYIRECKFTVRGMQNKTAKSTGYMFGMNIAMKSAFIFVRHQIY